MAACTETSSADTGSSATMTSGSPASARAMATRCFWPPESWRGLRSTKSAGSFTISISRRACSRIDAPVRLLSRRNERSMAKPTEWLGLSVLSGFWNTICSLPLTADVRSSTRIPPMSKPSSATLPSVAFSRPVRTFASVDLPQPDSADDGERHAALGGHADVVERLDRRSFRAPLKMLVEVS